LQFQHDKEEVERRDLKKMLLEDSKEKTKKGKRKDDDPTLQGVSHCNYASIHDN
jgi:hypothetical protein